MKIHDILKDEKIGILLKSQKEADILYNLYPDDFLPYFKSEQPCHFSDYTRSSMEFIKTNEEYSLINFDNVVFDDTEVVEDVKINYSQFIGVNFIVPSYPIGSIFTCIEIKIFGDIIKVLTKNNQAFDFKQCTFQTESFK